MTKDLRLTLLLAVLGLSGCERYVASSDDGVASFASHIRYFRDNQTGLCFAALESVTYGGMRAISITNVPCDKVKP